MADGDGSSLEFKPVLKRLDMKSAPIHGECPS